jgi:indolepyruvate ferredoxin oxidoreductase beta subunit
LPDDVAAKFPAVLHPLMGLAHQRLVEYQGPAYARLYIERLQRLLSAETTAGSKDAAHPVTAEATRWLALWMAFDDIVRVADLKSRASRWDRVTQEVKAKAGDVLKVYDHFKPGMPELAALLPQGLANRLLRWDRARVARGQAPWSMPLKVARHALWGIASLRLLASLRVLRPYGSRYATEQALIVLGQLCSAASAPLGFYAANFRSCIAMEALRGFPRGGWLAGLSHLVGALVREARRAA